MSFESFPQQQNQEEASQNITEKGMEGEPELFLNTLKRFNEMKSFSKEDTQELAEKTISFLKNTSGEFFENVAELYAYVDHEVIVRRENPLALVDSLVHDEPLQISFEGGEAYSNAALWQFSQGAHGLQNAFMEGFASVAGVCMVAGYEKNNLVVTRSDSADQGLPKKGSDGSYMSRAAVVAASGSVPAEEIDFVVARIPYHYMPEELLREDELDTSRQFVFRGVLRNKKAFLPH